MKTAIFSSKSARELELLIELAGKLGVHVTELTEEQLEEIGIAEAIRKGQTGAYVDRKEFLDFLQK